MKFSGFKQVKHNRVAARKDHDYETWSTKVNSQYSRKMVNEQKMELFVTMFLKQIALHAKNLCLVNT